MLILDLRLLKIETKSSYTDGMSCRALKPTFVASPLSTATAAAAPRPPARPVWMAAAEEKRKTAAAASKRRRRGEEAISSAV